MTKPAIETLTQALDASLKIEAPSFDAVEAELDYLEAEFMKKGQVSYFEIDWNEAFAQAMRALAAGAHIDAVSAASTAIIRNGAVEEFGDLSEMLSDVMQDNWQKIYPHDAKFDRRKKARLQDLIDAMAKRLEKEPLSENEFIQKLNKLNEHATSRGIDTATIEGLNLQNHSPGTEDQNAIETTGSNINNIATGSASSTAQNTNYVIELDAKGRSQLKRDVIALAERIEAFRNSDPLPYYLRGFAATLELKTAPDADDTGVTTMNAMPREISDGFSQAASMPNRQALQQLEQRLLNSPDWFEGQGYAIDIAEALNLPAIAAAIRHRVQNRLRALPEFHRLKYANGEDFIPHHIHEKFHSSPQDNQDNEREDTKTSASLRKELDAINQSEGLASVLSLIETKLKEVKSERERAIIFLERAEFLSENGYDSLAKNSIKELDQKFGNQELQEWDKSIHARISKICH